MTDLTEALSRVAIIGMAGRFPGAPDIATFWANLEKGREGIAFLTDDELAEAGVPAAALGQANYVKAKGVLEGADLFDAEFFGYSPREAEILDPQHRVFLECAWQALENAGCDPYAFGGRIGLFAGASLNTYLLFNLAANPAAVASAGEFQTLIANDKDFLTTRTSYKLNLKGPSVTVQTACSTSLTAVHLACQSLLGGECDIAIAGGVSVTVPLKNGYLYDRGGIVSPDGHCRAFDASAGGTVAGNGVGIVVLRRLADALTAGDAVEAVVLATAINNDGALKVGYTAPSVDGQAEVVAEALAVAGVDPATIGYVEAHGTGTALGDPIELAALTRAFREQTQASGYCAIGSVKSNIGHLDAAAGVTGLIKATLALKHEAIPATLNFTEPNPALALSTSPFFVNTEMKRWPAQETPRRAGVSSFGIGGTNVHVIIEEAPATRPAESLAESGEPAGHTRPVTVLPVSARSPAALAAGAGQLADHLSRHHEADLADVAYTLTRRRPFEYRRTIVCRDRDQAVTALRRVPDTVTAVSGEAPVAFLFPGQGAQYASMARGLYDSEPVFARELDRCADLFAPHLPEDLRTLLFTQPGTAEAAARKLEQTAITQPALFAVEYALAGLWRDWGLRPRAMAGHSIGEFVAACLAGVFSLPQAARLVAARGRLVQAMPPGAMVAVFAPEDEAVAWLDDDLSLAAVNSTALTAISGSTRAVDQLERRLGAAAVPYRRLRTSHAFHSPFMDGAVGPFVTEVAAVAPRPPLVPFYSCVTGTLITDDQATSPEYWGRQLRAPVRFGAALDDLLADPGMILLEVGPGETLRSFARQHRAWSDGRTAAGSLRHPNDSQDDDEYLRRSLGSLWQAGAPVDWAAALGGERHRLVPLPTYSFQRQRYWVNPAPGSRAPGGAGVPRPAEQAASADDYFYVPGWKRLPWCGETVSADAKWILLGADASIGQQLATSLEASHADVVLVRAGADLSHDAELSWSLDPANRQHYAAMIESVTASGPQSLHVVHLWTLGERQPQLDTARIDTAQIEAARKQGFDTLLALAQGIGDAGPSAPIAIDVLCDGVYSVTGEENLRPQDAVLLGPAAVIGQEVAGVTCRTLDVTGIHPLRPQAPQLRAILSMLAVPTEDNELALRGQHWWARSFDAVRLTAPADGRTRLRDQGVYLITGGLGGIGLELAEYIASNADAPALGLLGRSPFPAEEAWANWLESHDEQDPTSTRISRLLRLRELGARIVVLRADVTDPEQASRAVHELRQRFGAVNGIIHAAGLPSRGLMMTKSAADADLVLGAKTSGTLVLDQIAGTADCDFVVLCSSLAAVLGGPGQSDYAGANAFLDAYAQWKHQQAPGRVSAIGWDTWRDIGMAAGLAARLRGGGAGARPSWHPLLQRLVRQTADSVTYATTFTTADHWIVDEHRVMGHGLVPGAAYVELVRAVVAEQAADRVIEFTDVLFAAPVIVPDGQARVVYTTVERSDGRHRFAVRSKTSAPGEPARWLEHASGWVSFHDRTAEKPADLADVLAQCGQTELIDTEDQLKTRLKLGMVDAGGQIEFSFGPRWRGSLRAIRAGATRLLATLTLDDAFTADLNVYGLHPALLDLAGAAARVHAPDVYYMPLTYGSMQVSSSLTSTVHSYVELKPTVGASGETLTCDIEIFDPDGRRLARISDLTIKRINDIDTMLAQIEAAATAQPAAGQDTDQSGGAGGTLAALSAGITADDAVAAFARILAAPSLPAQVVVSGRNLEGMRRLARSITPSLLVSEIEQAAPLGVRHPRPDLDTPYVAPATEAEHGMAAIWREVLGIDQVGVDDDFFALGGHSLAAVQIGAKIKSQLGTELDLRGFFEHPTVAGAVAALSASRQHADAEPIPVLRRDEPQTNTGELEDVDLNDLSEAEVDAMLRDLLSGQTQEPGVTS